MPVPARLSLVTLGVTDLVRSTIFYQALGWPLSPSSVPGEVSFFRTAGGILALWGTDALAADTQLPAGPPPRYRGVALAMNLDSPADVDTSLAAAVSAGATLLRPAHSPDWGGYTGYFADPDGHVWEVAYNPHWPIGPDERPILP